MTMDADEPTMPPEKALDLVQMENIEGGLFNPDPLARFCSNAAMNTENKLTQPPEDFVLINIRKGEPRQHPDRQAPDRRLFLQESAASRQQIGFRRTADFGMGIEQAAQ